jgi:hypothetical protein
VAANCPTWWLLLVATDLSLKTFGSGSDAGVVIGMGTWRGGGGGGQKYYGTKERELISALARPQSKRNLLAESREYTSGHFVILRRDRLREFTRRCWEDQSALPPLLEAVRRTGPARGNAGTPHRTITSPLRRRRVGVADSCSATAHLAAHAWDLDASPSRNVHCRSVPAKRATNEFIFVCGVPASQL